jgi:type I restriction enzyme S subunit
MARTRLYPPSVDPGFPRLPPTPQGWRRTTFGDVLQVVERPIKLDPEAKYRLLTAKRSRGGITLRTELLGREILTKSQFEAYGGDFLISRRQIIHGACGVVPDDLTGAVVSNEYSTLRTRHNMLMDFLRYYSHTPYFQRTCFHSSHGVDVEKMIFKIDEWLVRGVDVPPLGEQRKIAAIFSSVDEAIEATQAVIDQLEIVKKAMMAELLTRGLPGRHTRFKQTEIGEVPEEWGVLPMAALVDSNISITYGVVQPGPDIPGGVLFIRSGDVAAGHLRSETLRTISEGISAQYSRTILRGGELLVALVGQPGACAIAPGRLAGANIARQVGLVRLSARVEPDFVRLFLTSNAGKRALLRETLGSVQQVINLRDLEKVPVPVPPIDEQQAIASVVRSVEVSLENETDIETSMRTLKSALMSVLLTGEVRVRPDEPGDLPTAAAPVSSPP